MSKIGIGLIGCGSRLRGVVGNLLKATDEVEIVAVCDPAADSIERARSTFNENATIYDDYHDLVKDERVSWVMIGSWNCFHAEQTIAAFAAGKHVFCEKPLATSLEDCLAMHKAWKASGKKFLIGFTLRYSPHYIRLRELLDAGSIGTLISMEFNETLDWNHGGFIHADWRRHTKHAGTHLLEKCSHDVDLVNWLVGSRAARVASFGGCDFFVPENEKYIAALGENDKGDKAFSTWVRPADSAENPFVADKDIIDNQVAIIEFENGVRSTFHTNCSTSIPERRMYFCGSEGTLRADVIAGTIELKKIGFDAVLEDCATAAKGGHGGGDNILGQSIADAMLKNAEPRASLEEGLASAITCFGIDEAMQTGKVVDMASYWAEVD